MLAESAPDESSDKPNRQGHIDIKSNNSSAVFPGSGNKGEM
jgi:hypothetical protein